MEPFVTIYSITYNQKDIIHRMIMDVNRLDYPRDKLEIIILDDGSTDGSLSLLEGLAQCNPIAMKVLSVNHEDDYLSAKRWNQCISASSPQTEVFIQIDDVRLRSDFIHQHVKWHTGLGEYLITGAKFEGDDETWDLNACRRSVLAGLNGSASECNFLAIWGASLSFTRKIVDRVWKEPYDKPYDERMRGWGFQETEFAYRVQSTGTKLIYDPAAGVFHKNHSKETEIHRGLEREMLVQKGMEQNERYLCVKHNLRELPWW